MSFAVHQHRKLTEVLPVPEGLRELMADITREVLRYQPRNIEAFIADYLESMLLTRELYQIANRTVEDVVDSSNQIMEILEKDGIPHEQAEKSVEVIKEEFKNHFTEIDEFEPLRELDVISRLIQECNLTVEQAQKASEVIESAWCHFYQRNKSQIIKTSEISPDFARSNAVKNTLCVYQKSPKVNENDLKKSSQILDIGFQGYFKRKFHSDVAQGLICEGNSGANWIKPNFQIRENAANKIKSFFNATKVRKEFQEKKKAATKIQANFKGYRARKEFKSARFQSQGSQNQSSENSDGNYLELDEEVLKLHESAKIIQSSYREHLARRELKLQHKSATIIQAIFRGYMTRKIRKDMNY